MNTNKHKEKNLIELLKKGYLSKSETDLKQRLGEISQDHIKRGLSSSTGCIGKQLQAHYDHIDNLIDYIIESIKRNFANISLEQCKEALIAIVDEEYKQLILFANGFLVKTGLASQSVLGNYNNGINRRKVKARQAIETKLAIMEEQRLATAKPWYKKTWTYVVGIIVFLATILLPLIWYILDMKERFPPK